MEEDNRELRLMGDWKGVLPTQGRAVDGTSSEGYQVHVQDQRQGLLMSLHEFTLP